MIYYGNPSTLDVLDAMLAGDLGCIVSPDQGNTYFPDEINTIADNGCFAGTWTETKWRAWLIEQPRTLRFAVCPDVFDPDGGPCHEATLERWEQYAPMMRRHGFEPAFVCQVGATPDNVPDDAAVLFLGGIDSFKLGNTARDIVRAHRDDRWIHMGRVNSQRRLGTALEFGCHSVDGTYLTKGPDKNLPRLLRFLRNAHAQPSLFGPD